MCKFCNFYFYFLGTKNKGLNAQYTLYKIRIRNTMKSCAINMNKCYSLDSLFLLTLWQVNRAGFSYTGKQSLTSTK